ncbi:MAG TPA: plasmid pRiA4b ORF-3 family protein [Phycisphaerae bacterium]|nr:plasmid pRiA4b ORF-3 family protein [Phycisphaerae bacterium]
MYELEVCLLAGPVDEEFVEDNPVVSRTIRIRGTQTLEQLHDAIFKAFDRWDEHMYEFQVGGKGPMDRKARRYTLGHEKGISGGGEKGAGLVSRAAIDSLGLKVGDAFGYWFDFGDDWWHQINVKAIQDENSGGKYPRCTDKVGKSPPQYPDLDDEDEEDEDDEDEDDEFDDDDDEEDDDDDEEDEESEDDRV